MREGERMVLASSSLARKKVPGKEEARRRRGKTIDLGPATSLAFFIIIFSGFPCRAILSVRTDVVALVCSFRGIFTANLLLGQEKSREGGG